MCAHPEAKFRTSLALDFRTPPRSASPRALKSSPPPRYHKIRAKFGKTQVDNGRNWPKACNRLEEVWATPHPEVVPFRDRQRAVEVGPRSAEIGPTAGGHQGTFGPSWAKCGPKSAKVGPIRSTARPPDCPSARPPARPRSFRRAPARGRSPTGNPLDDRDFDARGSLATLAQAGGSRPLICTRRPQPAHNGAGLRLRRCFAWRSPPRCCSTPRSPQSRGIAPPSSPSAAAAAAEAVGAPAPAAARTRAGRVWEAPGGRLRGGASSWGGVAFGGRLGAARGRELVHILRVCSMHIVPVWHKYRMDVISILVQCQHSTSTSTSTVRRL